MKFRVGLLLAALALPCASIADTCGIINGGAVDQTVYIRILDATTGVPNAGRAYNDSGIDLEYVRTGAAAVDITEATQTASGAHADGGFVSVGHGNYRLDLPDAAVAAGVRQVQIQGTITGYVVVACSVDLTPTVNTVAINGTAQTARDVGGAVPTAAAGASGGLLISGSNSGTTTLGALTITGATTHTGATIFTGNVAMAAGLNITQSSANTAALVVTGNGTGNGATITSGSGATGTGLAVVAASTNGSAATFAGVGTGNGITATGGATGHGLSGVGGSTSGNGIRATGTAGNSVALNLIGQGSAAGLLSTGGATGHGISAVGGATSGSGLSAVAATSGAGIVATGVGTTQAGIIATGGATSSNGITATGGGTGSGIAATSGSGATGNGLTLLSASTNGHGLKSTGTGTGDGAELTAGASGADLDSDIAGTLTTVTTATTATNLTNLPTIPTNWITANGVATDAIGAAEVAADVSTELLTGLANLAVNVAQVSGDSTAADNLETAFDDTAGPVPHMGIVDQGTAQSATGNDVVIRAAAAFPDNNLEGKTLQILGSTQGYWQSASIASNVLSTDAVTITPPTGWVTPSGTITYKVHATAPVSAGGGGGATAAEVWAYSGGRTITSLDEDTTTIDLNASYVGGVTVFDEDLTTIDINATPTGAAASVTGAVGSVTGAVGSVTGAVGSVTGNVGGNVTGSVGTVNAIAANAITAAATAADFTTEVTASVATASALSTLQTTATTIAGYTDDIGVAGAGLTAADDSVMTRLGAPAGASMSTDIAAVKAETAAIVADTNELQTDWANGGRLDLLLDGASSAGDPWTTSLPGAYSAGTAGYIVGSNLNATVSSRASQTSVDDVPTNAEIATSQAAADDATLAAIAALNDLAADDVANIIVEDQGGGISLRCAIAVTMAYAAGDLATTGSSSTYEDPSGTETRIGAAVVSSGNRTASVTCPSY